MLAPPHVLECAVHEAFDELGHTTSTTAIPPASRTDFIVTNLYSTKHLVRYACARTFKCFCSCTLG